MYGIERWPCLSQIKVSVFPDSIPNEWGVVPSLPPDFSPLPTISHSFSPSIQAFQIRNRYLCKTFSVTVFQFCSITNLSRILSIENPRCYSHGKWMPFLVLFFMYTAFALTFFRPLLFSASKSFTYFFCIFRWLTLLFQNKDFQRPFANSLQVTIVNHDWWFLNWSPSFLEFSIAKDNSPFHINYPYLHRRSNDRFLVPCGF